MSDPDARALTPNEVKNTRTLKEVRDLFTSGDYTGYSKNVVRAFSQVLRKLGIEDVGDAESMSKFLEGLTENDLERADLPRDEEQGEDEENREEDQQGDEENEAEEGQEEAGTKKKKRKKGQARATEQKAKRMRSAEAKGKAKKKKSTSSTPERSYMLFSYNDYLDMNLVNEGLLADSAGETSKTYRKRIHNLLSESKPSRADIYLMLAASLVTTNEARFYQALSAITSETNSVRISAWVKTNLASSFPEVAVLAGLQHDLTTCINRLRMERDKFDPSSGGTRPRIQFVNVKEVILHSVGYRVSRQLLLPPGLKVCAMASNQRRGELEDEGEEEGLEDRCLAGEGRPQHPLHGVAGRVLAEPLLGQEVQAGEDDLERDDGDGNIVHRPLQLSPMVKIARRLQGPPRGFAMGSAQHSCPHRR